MQVEETPIVVAGAGATGSWTVLALAKAGRRALTVYDGDRVEPANLAVQLYGPHDIGVPKVTALARRVASLTGVRIDARDRPLLRERVRGYLVLAVDTMAARRTIYGAARDDAAVRALLDLRVGRDPAGRPVGALYTLLPASILDQDFYEPTLHDDGASDDAGCSAAATAGLALLAAGLVEAQIGVLARGESFSPQVTFGLRPPAVAATHARASDHLSPP